MQNFWKTVSGLAGLLMLVGCATTDTGWTQDPARERVCVNTNDVRFDQRINDQQLIIRSGARSFLVTTDASCRLPRSWFSVALSDSISPVRYARHPNGQWIPVVEQRSTRVCNTTPSTLVIFENPLWTTTIPQQCRVVDITPVAR